MNRLMSRQRPLVVALAALLLTLAPFASRAAMVPFSADTDTSHHIIAVGAYHSIALRSNGTVWAWGHNDWGRLGNGTNIISSDVPVPVSNLTGVTAVAASYGHSLALKSDGTVWAWGRNFEGQLGNGTSTNSNVPVQVSNLTGVIAVAAGGGHSLALKSDGAVWAWGQNDSGQLGNGTSTNSNVPVQVSNLTGVIAVAAGGGHSLALKSDGTVWAWGQNVFVPVQVSNLTGVVGIADGWGHSLALKSDGTVWAWGQNDSGELGNGTFVSSNVPVQVSNLTSVVGIATGGYHSLARKSDGTVWAWGRNTYGELGNGTNIINSNVPVQVSGLTGAVAVAGGLYSLSLALKSDGTVWAWGGNDYGQLGNGTTVNSSVPVEVMHRTSILHVSVDGPSPRAGFAMVAVPDACFDQQGGSISGSFANCPKLSVDPVLTNTSGDADLSVVVPAGGAKLRVIGLRSSDSRGALTGKTPTIVPDQETKLSAHQTKSIAAATWFISGLGLICAGVAAFLIRLAVSVLV